MHDTKKVNIYNYNLYRWITFKHYSKRAKKELRSSGVAISIWPTIKWLSSSVLVLNITHLFQLHNFTQNDNFTHTQHKHFWSYNFDERSFLAFRFRGCEAQSIFILFVVVTKDVITDRLRENTYCVQTNNVYLIFNNIYFDLPYSTNT